MCFMEFINCANTIIRQRGEDYFNGGCVTELKKITDTKWTAKVQGSSPYNTRVEIDEQEVDGWGCTCPYEGAICKHVIATCYAIIDSKQKSTFQITQKETHEVSLKQIISSLSREELETQFQKLISKSPSSKEEFIMQNLDKVQEESKYSNLVNSICRNSIDNRALFSKCENLLVSAETLIDQNKAADAWEICRLLMENAVSLMYDLDEEQEEDDYDDYECYYDYEEDWDEDQEFFYSDLIRLITETIHKIATVADSVLQSTIHNWCLEGLAETEFDAELEESLLNLIGYFINETNPEQRFLELLDTKIANHDNDQVTELSLEKLLAIKIAYLKRTGREPEAWQIIEQYKHLNCYRLLLIDKYIQDKRFEEAINLCNQSLNDPEFVAYQRIPYTELLLKISVEEHDPAMQKHYTRALFFLNNYNMKYFGELKAMYSPEEWPKTSTEIEQEIIKAKSYLSSQALANIYVENQDYGKLLNILKNHTCDSSLFINYGKYAAKANELEFIACYQSMLSKKMEHTGRSTYEEVARHLHNLLSITKKPQIIGDIITGFIKQYSNRRAMIEIFKREFAKIG